MKAYYGFFYRSPEQGEIGPQLVRKQTESPSKAKAMQWARAIAKENDWRYLYVAI